jgi:hypothetical protein
MPSRATGIYSSFFPGALIDFPLKGFSNSMTNSLTQAPYRAGDALSKHNRKIDGETLIRPGVVYDMRDPMRPGQGGR